MSDEPLNVPKVVAEARFDEALLALDVSWRRLELAQRRLSRVHGVAHECKRLLKLRDQVKLAMNDLLGRRDQLREQGGLSLDELV